MKCIWQITDESINTNNIAPIRCSAAGWMKFFKVPILLFRNEKGTGAEIASGTCFWDRYWACAGVTVPEVFANPYLPISFSFVKANCFFSSLLFCVLYAREHILRRHKLWLRNAQVLLSLIYLFQFKVWGFWCFILGWMPRHLLALVANF